MNDRTVSWRVHHFGLVLTLGTFAVRFNNDCAAITSDTRAPQAAVAATQKGLKSLESKDFKNAIEHFSEAIRLLPNVDALHKFRGTAFQGQKMYEKAIEDYTKAIQLGGMILKSIFPEEFAISNLMNIRKRFPIFRCTFVLNLKMPRHFDFAE